MSLKVTLVNLAVPGVIFDLASFQLPGTHLGIGSETRRSS